jgi:hypothetical protein
MHRADEVVQDLAAAKYALTVGDSDRAMAAIDGALATARLMLATLLDLVTPPDLPTYAGALVLQALLETGDDHAPAVIPPTRRRSSA